MSPAVLSITWLMIGAMLGYLICAILSANDDGGVD